MEKDCKYFFVNFQISFDYIITDIKNQSNNSKVLKRVKQTRMMKRNARNNYYLHKVREFAKSKEMIHLILLRKN